MDMDMTRVHTFHAPTRLVFGVNAGQHASYGLHQQHAVRVVQVVDRPRGPRRADLRVPRPRQAAAPGF